LDGHFSKKELDIVVKWKDKLLLMNKVCGRNN